MPHSLGLKFWLGATAVVLAAPWLFDSSLSLSLLCQMGIAIIACLSYNLLMGQGGMLSFGHAVYTGLGAFGAMYVLNHASPSGAFPVSLVPLAGAVAGMAAALVMGYLSTRKGGTAFAMITLGLGELVYALALMLPSLSGGEGGIPGNRVVGASPWGISFGPAIQVYYLVAVYTLLTLALLYAFTLTPLGRLLNAVRDNPQRVSFMGYDPQQVRYLAFVISGFFAGIAGGLASLNFELVNAESLGAARSGAYLLFTYLGGTSYFLGPVLGGVLMVLATVLLSAWTDAWLLYLGLAFVATVMLAPQGLAGLLHAGWRFVQSGQWRAQLPLLWGQGFCVLAGLAGFMALVEMLYRLQLQTSRGPLVHFFGLPLDTRVPLTWASAAALCVGGLVVAALVRRKLRGRS